MPSPSPAAGSAAALARREVVVVTGASAGVGRAIAHEFARHGARVGLLARGREGLEAARAEVEAAGGEALVLPVDVADAAAVEAALETVERRWGPVDVWVNNAMATVFAPVVETAAAEYRRATEVTYLGYVHGTLAALRRMLPRDRGVIVQVGSALAYRSIPLQAAYCGAKAAIRGFTDSLRCELLHDRSRVHLTMVHLPGLNTPQFDWCRSRLPRRAQPVPPIFQPEVAARAVYFAAHARRREMFVGLPTLQVVIAQRLVPGLLDRFLAKAAYEGQMTPEPEDPARPDNLEAPWPRPAGTHGRFDDQARGHSVLTWLDTHRGAAAAALAGTLGLAAAVAGGTLTGRRGRGSRGGRVSRWRRRA